MSQRAEQNPARILVVDDTADNTRLLSDLLERQGYRVIASASGAEALTALARDPYDLILLDVVMKSPAWSKERADGFSTPA